MSVIQTIGVKAPEYRSDIDIDSETAPSDLGFLSREFRIRAIDILFSLMAIVLFLPLLVIIAISIALFDRGPVIFAHRRIGRGGQTFPCYKFRSMCVDADRRLTHLLEHDADARTEWNRDQKLRNDPRITPIGRILRKTSLDELPQLFNVLFGQMSLVGPRPIVVAEIPRYGRYFQHYCAVRPGITGLWQVSGRNDVPYRRRVALDVTYARAFTTRLNIRILLATVPIVLMHHGTY